MNIKINKKSINSRKNKIMLHLCNTNTPPPFFFSFPEMSSKLWDTCLGTQM